MKNAWIVAAAALLGAGSAAFAATEVVNGFGVNGWTSWDTRNTSGTQLVGTADTNAAGPAFFGKAASGADDTAIAQQIVFMGEGQTVNDAAGNTPPASPAGSLGGLGYVRLDGTATNSGKSDISFVNQSGITAASDLLGGGFFADYTFYSESSISPYISREPGLNISIIGTDSKLYTFSATPSYTPNAWNTEAVDNSTTEWSLFISGVGSGGTDTLADFAAGANGPNIFGAGADVWRVGFNLGSTQHDGLVYVDDLKTSLLNGGDTIDFEAPVPEPASISLLGIASAGLLLRRRKLKA